MRAYPRRVTTVAALIAFLCAGLLYADVPDVLVGTFSGSIAGGHMPLDWNPWILKNVKRQSTYALVHDDTTVIKATANDSASGLMRNIAIDPRDHPIVQWRWKVGNIIEKADVSQKDCNDSPARVYVAFAYDIDKVGLLERLKYTAAKHIYSQSLPLRAISYTWANKTPKETIVPMPYTKWFSQIVLENAGSPLNRWIIEERDVFEDYRKAFGEEPTAITGIAIMTNTDNMGGHATAWYGDITFRTRNH
jgi:hypothetical protein